MQIKGKCGHEWDGSIRYDGYECPVCGGYTKFEHKKYAERAVPDDYRIATRDEAAASADVLTRNYSGEWVQCLRVVYNQEISQTYAVRAAPRIG